MSPKGGTAAVAAAAAPVALVPSRQEDGGGPVLTTGTYSIPIGRASSKVVSFFVKDGVWVGG